MKTALKTSYRVLIADDSDDDRFFLCRALRGHSRFELIGEAEDGKDVIAYLTKSGRWKNTMPHHIPDLLLLDLKMSEMNGFEVLEWLKNTQYKSLKVIVLSGSDLDQDKEQARNLGARGYFAKTSSIERFTLMLDEFEALLDSDNLESKVVRPSVGGERL